MKQRNIWQKLETHYKELIDLALDTRDEKWFEELTQALSTLLEDREGWREQYGSQFKKEEVVEKTQESSIKRQVRELAEELEELTDEDVAFSLEEILLEDDGFFITDDIELRVMSDVIAFLVEGRKGQSLTDFLREKGLL